ncbi:helix-turn-helix domain-containing protein [Streptomyces sp. NBC_01280]
MADQQLNAPPRAQSQVPADVPPGGIRHINRRHADRYTVVGNHLVQHRQLSLTAIGLAAHIQSLPPGASATIKTLATRFPEGEVRIAAALRELEAHGYLTRTRERLPSGRVLTHTTSYNNPSAMSGSSAPKPPRKPRTPTTPPRPHPSITPSTPPDAAPERSTLPTLSDPASSLLADLRRDDPRLILPAREVTRLAPAVTEWLDRGITPDAVRRTLTTALPQTKIHHPAALLSHRLTNLLPHPLRPTLPATPHRTAPTRAPLQNCDGCDRASRSPTPGKCRSCRDAMQEAA